MRLTGFSDITTRTVSTVGTSASDKVASLSSARSLQAEDGIGVATAITTADSGAPVDADRVSEIRKALEEGRYPLVPAKIADAMIAAELYGTVGA